MLVEPLNINALSAVIISKFAIIFCLTKKSDLTLLEVILFKSTLQKLFEIFFFDIEYIVYCVGNRQTDMIKL